MRNVKRTSIDRAGRLLGRAMSGADSRGFTGFASGRGGLFDDPIVKKAKKRYDRLLGPFEVKSRMWTTEDHHKAQKIYRSCRERISKLDAFTSSGMRRQISIYKEGIRRLQPYVNKGVPGALEWTTDFMMQIPRASAREKSLKSSGL